MVTRDANHKKKQKNEEKRVSQCGGINQKVLNSSPKQMIYIFKHLLSTRAQKGTKTQQSNLKVDSL